MRSIVNLIFLIGGAAIMFVACEKPKALVNNNLGRPVVLTPSATALTPVPADSNKTVLSLNWTFPNYATDSANMKYIVEIDSAGKNFSREVTKTVTKNLGTSFTGRDLNLILLGYGYSVGTPVTLEMRVTSSYTNNNEKYLSNVVQITITPFTDLKLATEKTTVTGTLATGSQHSNTFTWGPAFLGYSGTVTYTIQYDSAGKNFVAPQEIPIGTSIYTKDMNQSDMNNTAISSGIPMDGKTGKVEYRVKATTSLGATAYSNVVNVTITTYIPVLRFYMPGSYQTATVNGTDWTPGDAPELIRDLRPAVFNKLYYIYIYLPANAEFKFTQGRDWAINYGGTNGTLSVNGANLKVATAGYYRITIDVGNLKYDIKQGRMGFVGGATGAGWTPGNVFPNYALGAPATNLFVGLTDFTTDGWKLIDSSAWNDGSNSAGETRSYGSPGGDGSTMEVNGANFPNITTAGRYRVIWDGRDVNNIKYFISPATEMRVVGDGITGVNAWDPPTSPQMTYMGNGVWTITIGLVANKDIKFLAANNWGPFDYEDNSGQSQAVGTPRKIKWEGGNNFKTPTVAGTYTITLDEKAQTVTIN